MSMNYKIAQEDFWSGNFGSEYVYRNKSESLLHSKMAMWASMLRAVNKIESARELGCNVGLNLLAIKRLKPSIQLKGYEINAEAVSCRLPYDYERLYQRIEGCFRSTRT